MDKCGTLLVAEQGCELAEGIKPWAQANGHHLIAVKNIRDVLITLQNEKVNVLVMDVCLPATTDVDDLAIIKGLYRRLPIIITATENNPDLESRVRKKGIFYYHVKSFGMDELLLAINNAMVRATQ
jgi:DNA-binding NtrC family response regulator